jgi:phosphoglycolate phosphatase-like HAD superfamily hydrolase
MKAIIFDLDLTLVDSTIAEEARHQRNWQRVYELIPHFSIYEGISEVMTIIREHNIKTCIVSTAPRTYVEIVINFFKFPIPYIVSYYDAKPVKPHPAQMLKALEIMGEPASNVISFGDRDIDIQASNSANIESVACFWGTKERTNLVHSGYSHAIIHPNEIITLIR